MSQSSSDRAVTTRRMKFDESLAEIPRHFASDIVHSHFWSILSATFPEGEDFFVRSVRHYRDEITDPTLKRQVAGFIGQEAMHGREHRDFNDRLNELGYPTNDIDRIAGKMLKFRERLMPAKANLAVTITIEHVTALLAEKILEDERVRASLGHEAVRDIYTWHAFEESEHKAVAFDVYRAVGGTERLRKWTGRFMRYGMVASLAIGLFLSVIFDREARRPGKLRENWRAVKNSPFATREMWEALKDFERPDFHPDDRDTAALLEEWREALFGEAGTLNDKRVGAAA